MFESAFAREMSNGMRFVMGAILFAATVYMIMQDVRHRLGWKYDHGTNLMIGVALLLTGAIIQSLFIWTQFIAQGRGGSAAWYDKYYGVLLLASTLWLLGGAWWLRVILRGLIGNWAWIAAMFVSVAVPLFVWVLV